MELVDICRLCQSIRDVVGGRMRGDTCAAKWCC